MKTLIAALALAAGAALVPFALAQTVDLAAGTAPASDISREEAIAIARDKGMTRVREVERDDGNWEVEGCTADRKEIDVDIHRSNGEIVKFEIDLDRDDDDC
ncbi:PepSY domain-containing protein [Hyphomonas sp.]|uniref:PepSY domain-containing protein n=1 Tax=Hyphomonas sp. TaxID=87 RepID=UPI0025C6ABD8|nr:PepSY domain-containing protein [Hyphomonas sp.]